MSGRAGCYGIKSKGCASDHVHVHGYSEMVVLCGYRAGLRRGPVVIREA